MYGPLHHLQMLLLGLGVCLGGTAQFQHVMSQDVSRFYGIWAQGIVSLSTTALCLITSMHRQVEAEQIVASGTVR